MKIAVIGCGIASTSLIYYLWKYGKNLGFTDIYVVGYEPSFFRCACGVQKWKIELADFDIYKSYVVEEVRKYVINLIHRDFRKVIEIPSRSFTKAYIIDRGLLQRDIVDFLLSEGFVKFENKLVNVFNVVKLVEDFDVVFNGTSLSLIDVKNVDYNVCIQGVVERGKNFEDGHVYAFLSELTKIGYAWVTPWKLNKVFVGLGVHKDFASDVKNLFRKFVKFVKEEGLIKSEDVTNVVTKAIPCVKPFTQVVEVGVNDLLKVGKLPNASLVKVRIGDSVGKVVNIGDACGLTDPVIGAGIGNTLIHCNVLVKEFVNNVRQRGELNIDEVVENTWRKLRWLVEDLCNRFEIVERVRKSKSIDELLHKLFKVYEEGAKRLKILASIPPLPLKFYTFIVPRIPLKLVSYV